MLPLPTKGLQLGGISTAPELLMAMTGNFYPAEAAAAQINMEFSSN